MLIVGNQVQGKTTLLNCLADAHADDGTIHYARGSGETVDIYQLGEAERRFLACTEWGFVHQTAWTD